MTLTLARLTTVRSADSDVRRRGRLLIILSLSMVVLALLFVPVTLGTGNVRGLVTLIVASVLFLGTAALGRSGRVSLGASLLIGVTLVAILGSINATSTSWNTPFYLVLPLLLASVLLRPVHIWSVLAACLLGMGLAVGLLPAALRADPAFGQVVQGVPLLLLMVAVVGFMSAQGVASSLDEARAARAEAEQASARLAAANAALEERVAERTAELRHIVEEQQATTAALQASIAARRSLDELVARLSVPVLPVSADTLVVPLVGGLDGDRAGRLSAEVLSHIEAERARRVILDVTGVPVVDTHVASALLRVAAAARLMGASTMLCGIRPEVAQALVNLGVELVGLETAATLQEGLARSLRAG